MPETQSTVAADREETKGVPEEGKRETADGRGETGRPAGKTTTFEEILEKNGYLAYITVGVSMLPLLRQRRDIVEIRARENPAERFKKYDVVLYKRGSKYILHRIIKVRPNDYVIVGDHNYRREYGITDDRILGVMTQVIRDGKEIRPDNLKYRLYVHLWCDFFPVRAMILFGKAQARRVVRKIRRILRGA